jgi:hypothetical protein
MYSRGRQPSADDVRYLIVIILPTGCALDVVTHRDDALGLWNLELEVDIDVIRNRHELDVPWPSEFSVIGP